MWWRCGGLQAVLPEERFSVIPIRSSTSKIDACTETQINRSTSKIDACTETHINRRLLVYRYKIPSRAACFRKEGAKRRGPGVALGAEARVSPLGPVVAVRRCPPEERCGSWRTRSRGPRTTSRRQNGLSRERIYSVLIPVCRGLFRLFQYDSSMPALGHMSKLARSTKKMLKGTGACACCLRSDAVRCEAQGGQSHSMLAQRRASRSGVEAWISSSAGLQRNRQRAKISKPDLSSRAYSDPPSSVAWSKAPRCSVFCT